MDTGRIVKLAGQPERISVAGKTVIAGELHVFARGGRIPVGEWCFVGVVTRVWSASSVTIGERVLISHGVNIHDCDSHPRDPAERHRHYRELRESGHPRKLDSFAKRIGNSNYLPTRPGRFA